MKNISVIIATFNSEKTLEKVLKSVRRQSFPSENTEILIVDGGSSDLTIDIAKKYKCRIINNPRTEPVYAKLLAFNVAKFRYHIYLDHDEVIQNKNSFKNKLQIFDDNPNIFAVAGSMKRADVNKQEDVFTMARKIESLNVGYETYFEQIMNQYNGEKYVMLITDSEQADNLEKRWLKAVKPEGAKLIVWQLKPYHTRISKDSSVVYVCGYSDRLLGLVKNIIEGKAGQIEEIEKVLL